MDKEQVHKPEKKPSSAIPKALRQQVWIQYNKMTFTHKCRVKWCKNQINVFNFHVGHNIPRSKGGTIELDNLQPICASCNLSMSDNYTIDEWNKIGGEHTICCIPSFHFLKKLCCSKTSTK